MQSAGNDYIGFDLLMNNKKSDAASVISSIRSGSEKRTKKKHLSSSSSNSDASSDASSFEVRSNKSYQQGRKSSSRSSSSYSASSDDSSSDASSLISSVSTASGDNGKSRPMSQEEILNTKRELLYQFDRLERKGVKIPKKFTLASSLDEMKMEYDRIKTDREVESSIRFQRQMLMTCVTGIEFMNNKFDPFDVKLDGWSETVSENITDYDDIFEELYHKYRGKAKMPPELRLLFALGGSAVMFHFSNSMMKYGFEAAMKQNPELVKQFAQATVNNMTSNPAPPKASPLSSMFGGLGGLGGIIGSLFGGGGSVGGSVSGMQMPQNNQPPPVPRTQMRGPSNVDDILKELGAQQQQQQQQIPSQSPSSPMMQQQQYNNDRIEIVSTISESEISEIPEDASMSGVFPTRKRTSTKQSQAPRRTLNI